MSQTKKVAIIMGSDSDYPVVKKAGEVLHDFGVPFYSVRRVEDIFPLGTISFEGKQFPAPADPDSYLRRIYGDYTKEPEDKSAHEIIF